MYLSSILVFPCIILLIILHEMERSNSTSRSFSQMYLNSHSNTTLFDRPLNNDQLNIQKLYDTPSSNKKLYITSPSSTSIKLHKTNIDQTPFPCWTRPRNRIHNNSIEMRNSVRPRNCFYENTTEVGQSSTRMGDQEIAFTRIDLWSWTKFHENGTRSVNSSFYSFFFISQNHFSSPEMLLNSCLEHICSAWVAFFLRAALTHAGS